MSKGNNLLPLMILFGLPLMLLEIILTTIFHIAGKIFRK